MDIFIKRFTRLEEAKQFWDASAYDIIDIGLALSDKGLKAQSLEFSLHFGEPDLMKIYSNFKINFQYIKDVLGIPEVYVDRNFKIDKNTTAEPARDASTLQYAPEKMKERFEKLMKKFKKELEDSLKKLDKEIKKLIDAGVLKKDQIKPVEINLKYEEELKKLANKK